MDIGARLRELRTKAKLSASMLGRAADLDQTMIYKIERNEAKPSLDALERLCAALGVSMAEFFAPDLTDLVLKKMESMHMSDEERAAYEVIKKMPPDKRQQSFLKTFEKYKNLSAKDREALDIIIDSLASSQQ